MWKLLYHRRILKVISGAYVHALWLQPQLNSAESVGLRGMSADKAIKSGDTIVSLPRTAALLVTPKMKNPFPHEIDTAYWSKCQWSVDILSRFCTCIISWLRLLLSCCQRCTQSQSCVAMLSRPACQHIYALHVVSSPAAPLAGLRRWH